MGRLMLQCLNMLLLIAMCSEIYCYEYYSTSMDKICSLKPGRETIIEMGQGSSSGVIVEDTAYLNSFTGKYSPMNCKFKIEATYPMGIFVVIQNMYLRKNKTTGECIDYVQFRHPELFGIAPKPNKNKSYPKYHCGRVNVSEIDLQGIDVTNGNNLIPGSFIDANGKIAVEIYLAAEPVLPTDKLHFKIAFTAYQLCKNNSTNYKLCGSAGCIWYEFFKDGIFNCPFVSCIDEEGACSIYVNDKRLNMSTGLATKVLVGAVAGVCTMFIVFLAFLWIFRHCAFCWTEPTSAVPNRSASPMIPIATNHPHHARPTAPSRSPSLDKDLPPSYESLFPTPNV